MEQFFVPGRLCLFGEHSDWAGAYRVEASGLTPGWCLVAGTDQGLSVEAEPQADRLEIESVLPDGRRQTQRLPLTREALEAMARGSGFFRYVAGAAAEMVDRFEVSGLSLRLRSDLPPRRGLSSSAAVCVAVVRAYARAYGLSLDADAEMELAYRGERRTGSECGRMDQVVAHGRRLTSLRFDGPEVEVERVEPGGLFHWLVIDLCRRKDTVQILRDLNRCYPATPSEAARRVRFALGEFNERLHGLARHALESGDASALGACMGEAQRRFDADVVPASAALEAPRQRSVLSHPALRELAHGAKGVGSQGDGCVQVLCRGEAERRALAVRLESDLEVETHPLTLGA